MQRLRYIRTGCLCRNNDSLAIAINKVEHRLTFSAKLIKSAVIAEEIGIVEDTRDFLAVRRFFHKQKKQWDKEKMCNPISERH